MDMSVVADWFLILFFLWFGLKKFIPALDSGFIPTLGALLAIGVAVFTFLT